MFKYRGGSDALVTNEKELKILRKILDNYSIDIKEAYKVRSVYQIVTPNNKVYCLKKTSSGKRKIKNGQKFVEELYRVGFDKTPKYVVADSGTLFYKHKGYNFYVMEWTEGKEVNLADIKEACECAKLLAEFHKATREVDTRELELKNHLTSWPEVFIQNIEALESYREIIKNKKLKNKFDYEYDKQIDYYINRALEALNILNNSSYFDMAINSHENFVICHDSYYYQNIIKSPQEKYSIIDLNNLNVNLNISDLGKYIRRLMGRKQYCWDFEKCKEIMESYHQGYALNKEDHLVMLALIVFPHKFCKLGSKRYVKNKAWSEIMYNKKLKKIIEQAEVQENFLREYMNYIENRQW